MTRQIMTTRKFVYVISAAAAAIVFAGCACNEPPPPPPPPPHPVGQIDANVSVKISPDGAGRYKFAYSGDFVDSDGNFDFTLGGANRNAVKVEFSIDPESVSGIKFMSDGAMWIALESEVGPNGSPMAAYRGDQFKSFATKENGKRMHVIDKNDDGLRYRYSLRFDLKGEPVVHDPQIKNGGGH